MLTSRKHLKLALSIVVVVILACLGGPARGQRFPLPPGQPAIIEFARPLCPVCKEMEKILLDVKARYRDQLEIRFAYMETDEYLFKKFHIVIVPTQILLDASGREIFRNEGMFPKEKLLEKLKEVKFIQK